MTTFETSGKETACKVVKVDDALGLVIGYAVVCKVDGEDYYDSQGDHIPEESMVKAFLDFMKRSRVAKEMHEGDEVGSVVFGFPMTTDIAKALGVEVRKTGFLIGMQPSSDVLAKFRSGEYTGFSIGGRRGEDEVVEA